MTEHDRVRMERALRALASEPQDLNELIEAQGGLQSTDAPELVPLWEQVSNRVAELRKLTPKQATE